LQIKALRSIEWSDSVYSVLQLRIPEEVNPKKTDLKTSKLAFLNFFLICLFILCALGNNLNVK
jgi:hypothetical protein